MFQDHAARTLKWTDALLREDDAVALGAVALVPGFKQLDVAKQRLVQMAEKDGIVLVGVRDSADGAFESGWILLDSGVDYEDHGDHGHWLYAKPPEVWDSRLDKQQGNPAHLYLYDGRFFLANDKRNGYTRIDPSKYARVEGAQPTKDQPSFISGGGNHITLAVVDDRVGYACWIDGGGPNKGRVDVTPIASGGAGKPAYSFHLPTGGIHGAIAVADKVFFAPQDGVCWVAADRGVARQPEQVKVHHVPLGSDEDKPRRTGAFVRHGNYVLFVTGKEQNAALVLLDAAAARPEPIFVPLGVKAGLRARTPAVGVAADGQAHAFVFHDRAGRPDAAVQPDKKVRSTRDVETDEMLQVIALDPDGDGDCRDAKVIKTLAVGRSAVEGHFGHHAITFDADRRFAFFTNPGDGTIAALSLRSFEVVGTFAVGGMPTAIVCRGGLATAD